MTSNRATARRGFGTVVMKEMAERRLDGAVNLDYTPLWRDLALDLPGSECAGASAPGSSLIRYTVRRAALSPRPGSGR
jgi:hypothetical protein